MGPSHPKSLRLPRGRAALLALAACLLAPTALPVGGSVPVVDDDAGSGRDAPATLVDEVRLLSGRLYQGNLTGASLDDSDVYAVAASAGDLLDVRAWGGAACLDVYAPDLSLAAEGCGAAGVGTMRHAVSVTQSGVWFVHYYYFQAQTYYVSVGINAPAAEVAPGALSVFASGGWIPEVSPANESDEHVVVAVVDTGINPYHRFFREPGLASHPSQWLAGFPADAVSVPLSLGAADQAQAMQADAATWSSLQRVAYDAAQDAFVGPVYTFPGTRVVAALSFGEYSDALTPGGDTPVFDEVGHGTHSAGLAAGANLPAADGDVLIVMVEISNGFWDEGVRWAARQPWIDAITVSAGVRANAPITLSPIGERDSMQWATLEAAKAGKPVFMASGNGFSGTGLAPDHCTTYTSEFTGPAWVTRIGAADPVHGNPTFWHCLPVEAIARTDVLSPDNDSFEGASPASGTSAATPNAAGHFARLLLDARRAGVPAGPQDALRHLLNASRPAAPAAGLNQEPSLAATAPADQGYGLVDAAALDRARATLLGGLAPEPRPELDAWVAADRALRVALWGEDGVMAGVEDDDAGSGGDAPDTRSDRVRIQPGVVYRGTLGGSDLFDYYAFVAEAGDAIDARVFGAFGCMALYAPDGAELASSCVVGGVQLLDIAAVAPADGVYFLEYSAITESYWFSFGLDAPAPQPLPIVV